MDNTVKEQENLSSCKKPIQRELRQVFLLFVVVIGLVVGCLCYQGYRDSIRNDYKNHLKGIMEYVLLHMDVDDLQNSIINREKSPKYDELQSLLDTMADTLDVQFIYIFVPLNEEGKDSALYIITSNTKEEYANNEVREVFRLLSGKEFDQKIAKNNMRAYMRDDVSFFITRSQWGTQYTAAMPIYNSKGERFALICADADYNSIHDTAIKYAVISILIIAAIGVAAALVLMKTIRRTVTEPLAALEKEAVAFANTCNGQSDIESIVFNEPEYHTNNEIDSLTAAIKQMSLSMRSYVQEAIKAEKQAENAEQETKAMSLIAYQDALTHVRNKNAYDEMTQRLKDEIEQDLAQFAILMVDINNLKYINDNFGHERGDEYIIGCCKTVCDVYTHSSVFRIGGDEFAIVLQGRDYDHRSMLLSFIKERFSALSTDMSREPWRRFSAAVGMSEYKDGDTFDEVFMRADAEMYKNKEFIKSST